MKKMTIIGGTGYIGQMLTQAFVGEYEIHSISRDWQKVQNTPGVTYHLVDASDKHALETTFAKIGECKVVINTAALKDVGACNKNIETSLAVNYHAHANVINIMQRWKNRPILVFVSSDKSCDPQSVYGCGKYLAEQLTVAANSEEFRTVVLRYGNVWGSTGSIGDRFLRWAKNGKEQTEFILRGNPTRFFFFAEDAVALISTALQNPKYYGTIISKKMESVYIGDLMQTLSSELGEHRMTIVREEAQPWEKQHEALVGENERYSLDKDIIVISPRGDCTDNTGFYSDQCVDFMLLNDIIEWTQARVKNDNK